MASTSGIFIRHRKPLGHLNGNYLDSLPEPQEEIQKLTPPNDDGQRGADAGYDRDGLALDNIDVNTAERDKSSRENQVDEFADVIFQTPKKNVKKRGVKRTIVKPKRSRKKKAAPKPNIHDQQVKRCLKRDENPMTNDLILSNLAKYLEIPALKQCRLVSRQWNSHAVRVIRKKHTPIVFNRICETFRFVRAMRTSPAIPFSSFLLKTKYSDRIDKYFANFGDHIRSLQVASKTGKDIIDLDNVYNVMRRTPNLEYLDVVNADFPAVLTADADPECARLHKLSKLRFTGWFPNFGRDTTSRFQEHLRPLNRIFKLVPNLRELELDIYRTSILPLFIEATKATPSLDQVTIRCLTEGDILRLMESRLALKGVAFNELQLTQNGQVVHDFLRSQQGTLETFTLRVMGNRDVRPIALPQMTALKAISIDTYFGTDITPFERIQHSSVFPALCKLCISQDLIATFFDAEFTCSTLEYLSLWMSDVGSTNPRNGIQDDQQPEYYNLYYQVTNVQLVLVNSLPVTFPNLNKLKVIDAKCSALRGIFSALPNLQELYICYLISRYSRHIVINLDAVLTGIPQSAWISSAVRSWLSNQTKSECDKSTVLHFVDSSAAPSIRLMTNLKVLELSGKIQISDAAAVLGLLIMQPLERLILRDNAALLPTSTLDELRAYHRSITVAANQK